LIVSYDGTLTLVELGGAPMRKIVAVPVVALILVLGLVAPAAAASPTRVIVLPGASSTEAIAAGKGGTFYAGDLFRGDIFKGDVRRGTAELFIHTPAGTRNVGMALDVRHGLLFVAGWQGKAYVYSTRTRALVASYDLGDPNTSFINAVTMTPFGAWFTDSLQPRLYFVPVVFGVPGPLRTLELSGPAAGQPGVFNINDIASTPSGSTLLVAPAALGKLVTINPITGASEVVAGVDVPDADGLLLDGERLWAVQTIRNKISRWRLNDDLSSGTLEKLITDPLFRVPLTAVKFGDRLAVTNSHLDTGFPPKNPTYEVLVVDA
jgi:sugar lactone lactonase YvrE